MLFLIHFLNDLFKDRKILLFRSGEKTESFKEGNDIFIQRRRVCDFVVYYAVTPRSEGTALQLLLNEAKNDAVFLRDVKGSCDFPSVSIIFSILYRNIEASLAVRKTGYVISVLWFH